VSSLRSVDPSQANRQLIAMDLLREGMTRLTRDIVLQVEKATEE